MSQNKGSAYFMVRDRIEQLVSSSSMTFDQLSKEYKKSYKATLVPKRIGYSNMKSLIHSIDSVKMVGDKVTKVKQKGKGKSQTVSNSSPSLNSHDLVLHRIEQLVSDSEITTSNLRLAYKERYKTELDLKRLGFSKMKKFVESIESIQIKRSNKELILKMKNVGNVDRNREGNNQNNQDTVVEVKAAEIPSINIEVVRKVSSFSNLIRPILPDDAKIQTRDEEIFDDIHSITSKFSKLSTEEPPTLAATLDADIESIQSNSMCMFGTESSNVHQIVSNGYSLCSNYIQQQVEQSENLNAILGNIEVARNFKDMALIGHTTNCKLMDENGVYAGDGLYLNTHIPFCMVSIGVQGAGKSHTLGCFLESCLLSEKSLNKNNVIRLRKPMTTVVLHYDESVSSICESIGLLSPSSNVMYNASIPKSDAVILVSPTYYKQRKDFYGEICTVKPLLFRWNSLTADHIQRFMRISNTDNQLYVASFMTLLRKYQREGIVPNFNDFIAEVKDVCDVKGQSGPLTQRIALLESIIAESDMNEDYFGESWDICEAISSGMKLIILDLTDPLLSKTEANSIFQVVTVQFRSLPVENGKFLVLDEAHKFMDGTNSDGLSEAIVNIARLMRHDGMRLAVSTQSPMNLSPALFELVSIAILHRFHSKDWWSFLQQKLPLQDKEFSKILNLSTGNALVFQGANRSDIDNAFIDVCFRKRLTTDYGGSRTNT
mmetsp:Transcript_19357/g.27219  ORF Transcript_19357/g.27219 Transcript_19357/m.27219 type:complete len:716 (+) Transcript_19357:294-2441(+)|eukprot:CAMPEP_0184866930 /NCGR_PEP_ID=MMETSP0580-20130426/24308_1 /TAXON_ID=1118495 /ORGANISM="Dactyliosolen fragilissimus" /LENGTH=715 /DNA_ID=CAMNT_0027366879 /DNA_START=216 /DNA_END=2363 /DNA_ORIENTATION=-